MYERFTERARQVIVLAQDESRTLKHNYIGTEHILLGLLREEEGLAARVLDTLDITVEEVRAQVARIVGQGDEVATGEIPFTPGAKKALELSLREALSLKHNYVGTEHILLGLVRETDGVGAQILLDLDADAETIRNEIIRMLSGPSRREEAPTGTARFFIAAEGEARSMVTQGYDDAASIRLVVACPACATPIERVTTDQRDTHLQISTQGNHTCPGCGQPWTITLTATWTDPSPAADPEDDIPSQISVRHRYHPPHFGMFCFRCNYFLEQVTLDPATPPLHIEAEGDRTCSTCGKPWRISYTVSWEERPGGSSAPGG
jgi:uncharacterized protein with PIN domain